MKLFKFIALVVVAVAVTGYFMDWYSVTKTGDDSYTVKLVFDKIKKATENATKKTRSALEKLKAKIANARSMTGTLVSVNVIAGTLDIKGDDGQTTQFQLDADSLEGGVKDLTALKAIAQGQAIEVHYEKSGDTLKALKIKPAK